MYFSGSDMSNNFNSSAGVVVVSGFHTSSVAVGNQIRVILMNRVVQADQAVCDEAPDVS